MMTVVKKTDLRLHAIQDSLVDILLSEEQNHVVALPSDSTLLFEVTYHCPLNLLPLRRTLR